MNFNRSLILEGWNKANPSSVSETISYFKTRILCVWPVLHKYIDVYIHIKRLHVIATRNSIKIMI